MSKRLQEGDCEERIAAKSRSVRNLVSRSRAGISTVPSSTASSSPVNFGSESHDVGLKASTGRLVAKHQKSEPTKGDTMWNSQEWHTDARSMASTGEPVDPIIDVDLETSRGYNLPSAE